MEPKDFPNSPSQTPNSNKSTGFESMDTKPPSSPLQASDSNNDDLSPEDRVMYPHLTKQALNSYWSSLTLDEKRNLLKVSFLKLKEFCSNVMMGETIVNEVCQIVNERKKWKLWTCCRCMSKFDNPALFLQHLMLKHLIPPDLQEFVLPVDIDSDCASMIKEGLWTPLSITDQSVSSDDCEREIILIGIDRNLRNLLESGLLLGIHFRFLRTLAREFVESIVGNGILSPDFDLNRCIRLLGISQLNHILSFLEESLGDYDEYVGVEEEQDRKNQVMVIQKEWIHLLFPEHSFCDDSAEPHIDLASWIFEKDDNLNLITWVLNPTSSDYGRRIIDDFKAHLEKIKDNDEEQFVLELANAINQLKRELNGIGMVDYHRPMLIILKDYFKQLIEDKLEEDLYKDSYVAMDQPVWLQHSIDMPNSKRKADNVISISAQRRKIESDKENGGKEALSRAQKEFDI